MIYGTARRQYLDDHLQEFCFRNSYLLLTSDVVLNTELPQAAGTQTTIQSESGGRRHPASDDYPGAIYRPRANYVRVSSISISPRFPTERLLSPPLDQAHRSKPWGDTDKSFHPRLSMSMLSDRPLPENRTRFSLAQRRYTDLERYTRQPRLQPLRVSGTEDEIRSISYIEMRARTQPQTKRLAATPAPRPKLHSKYYPAASSIALQANLTGSCQLYQYNKEQLRDILMESSKVK